MPEVKPSTNTSKQRSQSLRRTFSTDSKSILKSEVEQLDDSIKHLVKDPKAEVLENIKRRHGITKSPSVDGGLYTFPQHQHFNNHPVHVHGMESRLD